MASDDYVVVEQTSTLDIKDDSKGMRVMIAIDASEFAKSAFDHYFESVHHPDNVVIFAHTMDSPFVASAIATAGFGHGAIVPMPHANLQHLVKEKRKAYKKLINEYEKAVKALPFEVKRKFHITEHASEPGDALVKISRDENVEMIVIGTRGMGTVRRTLLGSVSDYVLHHSKVPVMVVHKED